MPPCALLKMSSCAVSPGIPEDKIVYSDEQPRAALRLLFTQGMLVAVCLITCGGCTAMTSLEPPDPASPFFPAEPTEVKAVQFLGQKAETQRKTCAKSGSCEDILYTRGLTALFESRASALVTFQELQAMSPRGRYAASSARWVKLIQESPADRTLLIQLREEVLHHLLRRDEPRSPQLVKDQARRITELERQLHMLKLIEQERQPTPIGGSPRFHPDSR